MIPLACLFVLCLSLTAGVIVLAMCRSASLADQAMSDYFRSRPSADLAGSRAYGASLDAEPAVSQNTPARGAADRAPLSLAGGNS